MLEQNSNNRSIIQTIKGWKSILLLALLALFCYLLLDISNQMESEISINTHLPDTYRVVVDGSVKYATSMPPLAESIKEVRPEVIASTRLRKGYKLHVEHENLNILTDSYFYVDPDFFEVFELKFISGDPALAFNSPNSVVLSHQFAQKVFETNDPLGNKIVLDNSVYLIAGTCNLLPLAW